jgi:HD-GYP domain-containing protein (c-di-GMP phosphodiesterase class II)
MFLLVCFTLMHSTLSCRAQDGSNQAIPDFSHIFRRLRSNIIDYNKYNDSIFLIHDHNDWIQFFLRRAEHHHEIFAENKQMINSARSYFNPSHTNIPHEAYHQLFLAYLDFMNKDPYVDDAFLSLEICDILEQHYSSAQHADSTNNILRIKLWQAYAYWSVYVLTQDTVYAQKSKECYLFCFNNKNTSLPYQYRARFTSATNLMSTSWMTLHLTTLSEHLKYRNTLQNMLHNDSIINQLIGPKNLLNAKKRLRMDDNNLARNVGIVDSISIPKHFTDSIIRGIVLRNDTLLSVTSLVYYNNLLFETYLGQIDYTEALKQSMHRYKKERRLLHAHLDDTELLNFILKYFTISMFNDRADISYRQKRNNVLRFCRDIVTAYQRRKDQQYATNYIHNLEKLVTYDRLIKYLTPTERIDFLNKMYVATQVTTYAHCVHVAKLADVMTDAVLSYEPQLFCNTLGHKNVASVMKHAQEYIDFAHNAAMYHDLGKNSLTSIIINECRPTTDLEYSIIKTHPDRGMKYLSITPELQRYHDTTLGHHKWYNDNGGYPADYDNTRSKVRIMTDIVTLCDCMQAATEKIGRNYKKEKPFYRFMEELNRDAGTRYNPQLVDLINQHPDIYTRLQELVEDGWLEVYYNIYSQFFKQDEQK